MHRLFLIASISIFTASVAANEPSGAVGDESASPQAGDQNLDSIVKDRETIQGTWTEHFKNQNGMMMRTEIELNGDIYSHSEFDPQGNLVESNRGTFCLCREGNARLLTISNWEIIAGPNMGARPPGQYSLLYRIEGDNLYGVLGLRESDPGPLRFWAWKRKK